MERANRERSAPIGTISLDKRACVLAPVMAKKVKAFAALLD